MAESEPLMDENAGVRNTTLQFLRSFSVISEDSDFDELEEPDTAEILDEPDVGYVSEPAGGGQRLDRCGDGPRPEGITESKVIPFSAFHRKRKGFENIRSDCWNREPVTVRVVDVQREEHPHMSRNAFNPNLYTIDVTHGEYQWQIHRRYKHFLSLHNALMLFKRRYQIPVPTRQHREMRQSMKEERKERKKEKKISRFPKKPEIMVKPEGLDKRKKHLEDYLQSILKSKWYKNHTETLEFLEVSELSFINQVGQKRKEGAINKCSGGRRISIGCCGCLKKYHVAGRWSDRWLIVKDTFLAYIRPRDGVICDVLMMDSDFKVETGINLTGAPHGLLITNLTRNLLAKCWTGRKADEWEKSIKLAASTTGREFTQENRFKSFAPKREQSYARWFVDGSSYFEAVADALEKAKEEIFITDWWLSPEIYMKRMVTDREKWRLDEILGRKAKAGVKVFVILYKEMEIALSINSHYSKHSLMKKCPENIKVLRHPDHLAGGNRVLLWAHHEKMVVIDQKIAFYGGLDICYGRWDDETHKMTDLGSIQYSHRQDPPPLESVIVTQQNPRKRKTKNIRPPSTILEAQESREEEENLKEEEEEEKEDLKEEDQGKIRAAGSQSVEGENVGLDETGIRDGGVSEDVSENRLSSSSEREFGSNDVLTDNDSLEDGQKQGYTNVMAEVTVHHEGSYKDTNSGDNKNSSFSGSGLSKNFGNRDNSEKTQQCNNKTDNENKPNDANNDNAVPEKEKNSSLTSIDRKITKQARVETSGFSESPVSGEDMVDVKDIDIVDTLFDKVESQIVHNGNHPKTKAHEETDCNKNATKASVRFREDVDGEIKHEEITPVQSTSLQAMPKGKKADAANKRESWASRKLRRSFGQKHRAEKYEDDVDGRKLEKKHKSDKEKGDKSDKDSSDSDSEGISGKIARKWRLVLDIKKLEHAVKHQVKDDDSVPQPENTPTRQFGLSPHTSIGSRIRQSMNFRRQKSDDDLYHDLYPWKHSRRKDEVTPISIMKGNVSEDIDLAGLEGSSKLWIGKDYVNFIHKDPIDVHNPFEDFIARDKTPRMPWHDIGGVVYGKAARDIARHFIQRWNFTKTEKFKTNNDYPMLFPKSYTKCQVPPAIRGITYEVHSQVLRSTCGWSAGIKKVEKSIHTAYIECIKRAKHYIYIENQFFITQVGDQGPLKNQISDALLERILRAHKNNEMFRVYVVLPLLPAFEGDIGAEGGYAIKAVTHWNYQSISKGANAIWTHLLEKVDDPKKYMIFCGLRSHDELAGRLVTELVYVHSKLMIVDDDTVIIGSANINDRSMIGTRDSELAVLIEDVNTFPVTMGGKEHQAGRFASSLRRTLFREHLGLGELELDPSINLSDPVSEQFYKKVWIERATINTTIYHKVFQCIPDDHLKTFADVREINSRPSMADTDPQTANEELRKVRGRIVLLPLYFLEDEVIMPAGANREAVLPLKMWL